jgi:hypothetical protein
VDLRLREWEAARVPSSQLTRAASHSRNLRSTRLLGSYTHPGAPTKTLLKEVGVAAVESANVRGAEAVELGVDPLGREGWRH